jgi:hypothetical protein
MKRYGLLIVGLLAALVVAVGAWAGGTVCVPAYQAKTTLNSYTNMLYPVGFNSKLTVAVTGLCASNATAGAYSGSVVLYWTP